MNPEKSGFNPAEEDVEIKVADDGSEITETSPEVEKAMADVAETGKSEAEEAVDNVVRAEAERRRQEDIKAAEKKIEGLNPEADISRGETKEAMEGIEDIVTNDK